MWFNLAWTGGLGAIAGFLTAQGQVALMIPYAVIWAAIFAGFAFVAINVLKTRFISGWAGAALFLVLGIAYVGVA